jgi:hypothetical protein
LGQAELVEHQELQTQQMEMQEQQEELHHLVDTEPLEVEQAEQDRP